MRYAPPEAARPGLGAAASAPSKEAASGWCSAEILAGTAGGSARPTPLPPCNPFTKHYSSSFHNWHPHTSTHIYFAAATTATMMNAGPPLPATKIKFRKPQKARCQQQWAKFGGLFAVIVCVKLLTSALAPHGDSLHQGAAAVGGRKGGRVLFAEESEGGQGGGKVWPGGPRAICNTHRRLQYAASHSWRAAAFAHAHK